MLAGVYALSSNNTNVGAPGHNISQFVFSFFYFI
jgi:hypothetical protein